MQATSIEHLSERLVCLMDAVARGPGTSVHQMLEECGITPGQLKALLVVCEGEGPSVSTLAAQLELSLPTVSRIVEALTRRGWVERRISDADRRTRILAPTTDGAAIVTDFSAARARDVRRFVERLSVAQQGQLEAALDELEPVLSAVA